MSTALITSYVNPDLDGIACMVAYAELLNALGKDVVAGYFGEPSQEARYVLDRFQIPYPKWLNNTEEFETIVLVDASVVSDLEGKVPLGKVIEIVDHRKINDADKFPNANVQIELVGSATTLIAEKLKAADMLPSRNAAILMVSAIISNTFNFQAGVATDRDRAMYDWLSPIAKLPDQYARELFLAKSDLSGHRLQDVLRDDLAIFDFGKFHAGIAQIEMAGGFELVQTRKQEILTTLQDLKKSWSLDWIFLSIVELEKGCNIFIATDEVPQKALSELLHLQFNDEIAIRQGLMMRKETAALLKEHFGKKDEIV